MSSPVSSESRPIEDENVPAAYNPGSQGKRPQKISRLFGASEK